MCYFIGSVNLGEPIWVLGFRVSHKVVVGVSACHGHLKLQWGRIHFQALWVVGNRIRYPADCWTEWGFSLLLAIAQVLRKGGGLTSLPLGPSIEQPKTLQQLHQNEQESAPTRRKSVFPNLVSTVASHHFRSTLFIRNRSLGSGHIQGEDITQGMNILGQGPGVILEAVYHIMYIFKNLNLFVFL